MHVGMGAWAMGTIGGYLRDLPGHEAMRDIERGPMAISIDNPPPGIPVFGRRGSQAFSASVLRNDLTV